MDVVTHGAGFVEVDTMEENPSGKPPVASGIDEEGAPEIRYCVAAESVMSNEYVVAMILESFRKVEDLKVFRLINPVCYRMATKLMARVSVLKSSRLEYLKMKAKEEEEVSNLGFLETYYHKYLVFSRLNSLLRSAAILPFEAVCIHSYMWDLKNPEVMEFFKRFGKLIKTVIFGSGTVKVKDLREILLVRVAHVEEVIIDGGFRVKSVGRTSDDVFLFRNRKEKVKLPKLKVIRFRRNGQSRSEILSLSVIEDLIDAAVNLELVYGYFPTLFPAIVTAAKATAVKTLEFSSEYFPYIDIFVESELCSLKSIIIKPVPTYENGRACRLLTKLFEMSQYSLEAIEFDPALTTIGYTLKLPVLGGIRHLNLVHLFRFYRGWITGSTAASIFPNVKTVVVDTDCVSLTEHFRKERLHEDNDYSVQSMPSVEVLNLNGGMYQNSSFLFLGSKFPNLKKIQVELKGKLYCKMSLLWSLPKQVETLVLTGVWLEDFGKFKLDEFLTGIPSNVCAIMQHLPMDSIDFTMFQKTDSILLLRNLKHFTLQCLDVARKKKTWEDEKLWGVPYASKVSRQFVFTAMPNLRLKFVFPQHYSQCLMTRESLGLRDIAPFAELTVKHEPF